MQGELEEALTELKSKEEAYRRTASEGARTAEDLRREQEQMGNIERQRTLIETKVKVSEILRLRHRYYLPPWRAEYVR